MSKNQNESVRNFARHCHSFYLTSLSPAQSVHLSQTQASSPFRETEENNTRTRNASSNNNGKIVIEVFDKICAISAALNKNHTTLQDGSFVKLKNEHDLCAKDYHELLMECGLLEIDQFTILDNASTLLELYNEVRHKARRQAHKTTMKYRQNSFFEMLSQAEKQWLDDQAETCTKSSATRSTHTSTTVDGIKATISSTEKFVAKYKPMIGSHSFLAGLHKFIHLQLTPKPESNNRKCDPYYVVQWEFRGSVLTEACMPAAAADVDELSYARDALHFLFHFLIRSKEVDVEGGSAEDGEEPMVSFEIHKHVSNATLCRILNALPSPTSLDARATGSLALLKNSGGERVAARLNVDGHLDEPWPLFHNNFLADYCTLL